MASRRFMTRRLLMANTPFCPSRPGPLKNCRSSPDRNVWPICFWAKNGIRRSRRSCLPEFFNELPRPAGGSARSCDTAFRRLVCRMPRFPGCRGGLALLCHTSNRPLDRFARSLANRLKLCRVGRDFETRRTRRVDVRSRRQESGMSAFLTPPIADARRACRADGSAQPGDGSRLRRGLLQSSHVGRPVQICHV